MQAMDQLSDLAETAQQRAAEVEARRIINTATTKLMFQGTKQAVFFSSLIQHLKREPCWSIPTAATDGRRILYNPKFFVELGVAKTMGVLIHEVLHVAFQHVDSSEGESRLSFKAGSKKGNIAADLAINPPIIEAGLKLPEEGCFPGKGDFRHLESGKSAEWYYRALDDETVEKASGPDGDAGGCGTVFGDAAGGDAESEVAEEWSHRVAEAANAAENNGQGTMPLGLSKLIGSALESKVDWRDALMHYLESRSNDGVSWSRPNRRFIGRGLYLPSSFSRSLGDVLLVWDTSGSMGGPTGNRHRQIAGELEALLSTFDTTVHIVFHDADHYDGGEWTPSSGPLEVELTGFGGTDHRWLPEYVMGLDYEPSLVLCMTDMGTSFPDEPLDVPTIWCCIDRDSWSAEPPFGELIDIPA